VNLTYKPDLEDFNYVEETMIGKEGPDEEGIASEIGAFAEDVPVGVAQEGCLAEMVKSTKFNILITLAILGNSITVVLEELLKDKPKACDETQESEVAWLVIDGIFTGIFILEFVLKFAWLKCAYFCGAGNAWNRFDFFLVIAGTFGLVMNCLTKAGGASLGNQARLIKLARLLRTMRFLRVFRLLNAKFNADKYVSPDLAKHMKKITTLYCYIKAHLMAQNDLVKYFGGNGRVDTKEENEIARCVLQSQVFTYKALVAAATTQKQIDKDAPEVLEELKNLYLRKTITEGLSHFVEKAHSDGAINAKHAHDILHPLHKEMGMCMKEWNERVDGVMSSRQSQSRTSEMIEGLRKTNSMNTGKRASTGAEGPPPPPDIPGIPPSASD
jgi:hypothetical protein